MPRLAVRHLQATVALLVVVAASCCEDRNADNYKPGSGWDCIEKPQLVCADSGATNYDPEETVASIQAMVDDGVFGDFAPAEEVGNEDEFDI